MGKPEPSSKKPKPRGRFGQMVEPEEKPEQVVRIALGDQEYIANVDPKLENPEFRVGTQIKVNEAFAVIGDLGYAQGGPIVKISEILENGRLRAAMESQGMQSRVLYGGAALREQNLKA